jgi:hypothetical protein
MTIDTKIPTTIGRGFSRNRTEPRIIPKKPDTQSDINMRKYTLPGPPFILPKFL